MPDWESGPRKRCEVVLVAPGAGERVMSRRMIWVLGLMAALG
jgi:hypothetical protein